MQDVRDRVRLVDASEIGTREIQATVPRAEIEDVLRSKDGDPELVIDVTRGDAADARTLRLAWDQGELEELLRKADGDNVTLAFNGSELERALEADVEAHGLREAAVVLAVAATTAAAGASIAQGALAPQEPAGPAVTAQAQPTTGGTVSEREWPLTVNTSAAPSGVSEREWPEVVGGAVEQSPAPDSTKPGVVSEREWPLTVNTSSAPSGVSEREWPEVVGGTPAQSPAATSTDTSGSSDAATAGVVAGGAVLLISAAGFAVRRRRDAEPRPA
jgi:hypothetical protein